MSDRANNLSRAGAYPSRPTAFAQGRLIAIPITSMMITAQAWPILAPDVLRGRTPPQEQERALDLISVPHALHLTMVMRRKPSPSAWAALKGFVLELLDLASTTPEFDVVASNQTAGMFFCDFVAGAF